MKAVACSLLTLLLSVSFWGCSKSDSGSVALQSGIDFTKPEAIRATGAFGVYEDGWVGAKAEIALQNSAHSSLLWIAGTNVETRARVEALRITVLALGDTIAELSIPSLGDFRESILIPRSVSSRDTLVITLISSKIFVPSRLGTSKDDRTLSFRLKRMELASLSGTADTFPRSFTFPRKPDGDPNLNGIYDDGWMTDSASVTLYNQENRKMLEIRGTVPGNVFKGPATLDLIWKGQLLLRHQVQGNFRIQLLLPESAVKESRLVVSLKPMAAFVPADLNINSDHRRLSYQLESIVLK